MKLRIFTFLMALCFLSCKPETEAVYPKVMDITEAVYASATIKADSTYQIYATVGGLVEHLFAEEGQMVSAGQSLLQIRNLNPKLAESNAQLSYELARKNLSGSNALLKQLEEEIRSAQLKYHNDSLFYFRQKRLWEQRIGSQTELEQKQLAYELSSNQLKVLRSQYALTRTKLQTELEQASNTLAQARELTGDYQVKSKINGRLYTLDIEEGEQVIPQQALGSIGSADRFIIELLVDEEDITRIRTDMLVLVSLDAFSNAVYEARITRIYPAKNERNQTFLVEAVFDAPPAPLYPGLSGEANIVVAQKKNALCVPTAFLNEQGQLRTPDGMITVETGLKDLNYTEITAGLDKDTRILPLQP